MNLTVWDLATDGYDHTELANNWSAVDTHDHTTGKGVQIPTGGILNLAITTAKLADNSVTSAKIVDGTITGADIAAGTITSDKLDASVDTAHLGACISLFRPSLSFPIPAKWHIADGSTLAEGTDHDWTGAGNVVLPRPSQQDDLGSGHVGHRNGHRNATGRERHGRIDEHRTRTHAYGCLSLTLRQQP
jgi:hypothetical protein